MYRMPRPAVHVLHVPPAPVALDVSGGLDVSAASAWITLLLLLLPSSSSNVASQAKCVCPNTCARGRSRRTLSPRGSEPTAFICISFKYWSFRVGHFEEKGLGFRV